jgi:hypothetical protein
VLCGEYRLKASKRTVTTGLIFFNAIGKLKQGHRKNVSHFAGLSQNVPTDPLFLYFISGQKWASCIFMQRLPKPSGLNSLSQWQQYGNSGWSL